MGQNSRNQKIRRKNNTSGFKGVYWHKARKKWRVQITVDGKNMHLGSFDDKKDAAQAYNDAAVQYHGEFAKLNEV